MNWVIIIYACNLAACKILNSRNKQISTEEK